VGGIGGAVLEALSDAGQSARIVHLAVRGLPGSGTPAEPVHVRGGQAGPGKFTILDLASGDKDPERMVNDAGDPAMPPGERHKAVHDQEGDKRDRADGERRRRRRHGPADDRADGDGDREVERAELGKRASLSKPQADDGHRKHQDRLDRYPAETARLADQFQQPLHPLRLSPARVPAGPGLRSDSPEP
jgi:hypothetical protein